jgi:hypothetical protein
VVFGIYRKLRLRTWWLTSANHNELESQRSCSGHSGGHDESEEREPLFGMLEVLGPYNVG